MIELALARIRLGSAQVRDLAPEAAAESEAASPAGMKLAELLAYVVPRVARRMPWRSDCLVQALAARHWLGAQGVTSRLHIGSRSSAEKGFEAHAWLTVGELVVTGWDIENFAQFVAFPSPRAKQTSA